MPFAGRPGLHDTDPRKAGRSNGRLRRPWEASDRAKQRANAVAAQPWRLATGPRTAEGKLIASANGRHNKAVKGSRREVRASVADAVQMADGLRAMREALGAG